MQVGDVSGPLDADEPAPAESDSAEPEAQPSAYELKRERNIARNAAFLDEVGLGRDPVQSAPSKERVRPAASKPALVRRTQRPRQCKLDPPVAAAARADAVADVRRQPVAAAASDDDAAGRMREHMRRQRQRPGPQAKDGSISTVCRKVDCRRVAVRGPKGRALAHGLCRICAAEARVGAMATAALQRSKRKAEDDAAGEAAEAAVRRQPSDNAKGKARRVAREDEEEDADDAFEEVYKCRTDGCCLQATRFKSGLPTGHGMCRVHGPYKERVRCSMPSCDERARVNGRCKLHNA